MRKMLIVVLIGLFAVTIPFFPDRVQSSAIGEQMQGMEATKTKKQKELSHLEELETIIANEIATAKAEMADAMTQTVQAVGRAKANPEGLVTTSGGVVHGPSDNWKLDVNKLRQEYHQAGIYTPEEIDTIVEFHRSYVQNRGFTAGIAEQLAKVAEATAQQRTVQRYIAVKKQEIKDLEKALQGSVAAQPSTAGNYRTEDDGGGGGGGGGY